MLDASRVSKLGFGCMRFEGRETDSIDIEYTSQMIDRYMEAGGNYFDTAWAYPNSEAALGKALVARHPRDSYILASKCVGWIHCEKQEDLERQLQESLAALGVDYLDVYLLHNLGGPRTAGFERVDAWGFMKTVKERGLAKHTGFSAHCTPDELEGFLERYPETEVVQLQVNYADWDNPSFRERECVEICRKRGIPVIAMEPVKGGLLADPPAPAKAVLDAELPKLSYAGAALRFTASMEGVATALSGMHTLEMIEENCALFEDFEPMTDDELATMKRVQEALAGDETVPCTGCDYCAKVCPQGIGISGSLNALNYLINTGDAVQANYQLGMVVHFNEGKKLPNECIHCHKCEQACPQNIPILQHFARIEKEIIPFEAPLEVLMKM